MDIAEAPRNIREIIPDTPVEIISEGFEIINEKSYPVTETTGGGGGGSIYSVNQGYVSGHISPIYITSHTTHHQRLICKATDGSLEETIRVEDSPIEFRQGGKIVRIRLAVNGWTSEPFFALYSVEQDRSIVDEDKLDLAFRKAGYKWTKWPSVAGLFVSLIVRTGLGIALAGLLGLGLNLGVENGTLPESLLYRNDEMQSMRSIWIWLAVALFAVPPIGWLLLVSSRVSRIREKERRVKDAIARIFGALDKHLGR